MIGTGEAQHRVRRLLWILGLLPGLAALAACDDDTITNVLPAPIITTATDPNFNFSGLHTFAMPDTVAHFVPFTGVPLDVPRTFDRAILDRVRQQFLARGYTQVTTPQTVKPDFVVLVGTSATTNLDAYVTYSWYPYYGYYSGWGWYAPGFDASWGLVYPWYATVGVTSYDRGTLVVTMVPTLSVQPVSKTIRASWAGLATAPVNDGFTTAEVTGAIDEMFAQSPYLVATP